MPSRARVGPRWRGILGALLASALASSATAQGVAIGVKGGLVVSDLSSDQFQSGSATGRTGAVGGAFITFAGRDLAAQPEILFSQRGFDVLGQGGTAATDVSYVDVPIMIKIGLRPNRKVRPALVAGGFFALETSCRVSGGVAELPADGNCDAFFPARGKADAGIIVGGAVDIGLTGRYFLVLDARYAAGLLNLNWDDVADRVSSRTFSLMAGFGILLGS